MHKKTLFHLNDDGHSEAVRFVRQFLEDCKIDRKARVRAVLTADEAIGTLVAHSAGRAGDIRVRVRSLLGAVTIELSAPGEEYALAEDMASAELFGDESAGEDTQDVIRNILLRSLTDDLKYSHKNGVNHIRLTLVKSRRALLYQTLGAMLAAIVIGLLLANAAPETFNAALNANLLSPIKTMYMNALKMVVAPVVFFSIVSCIVQFSNLSDLGRIGGKILILYVCTTVIAVGVGIGAYALFRPGSANLAQGVAADATAITSQTMNVSIKDTVVGIVPSNILDPFLKADMLQLIFLAVLCGVATGLIGKYSDTLKDIFQACNDLFLKITTMIIRVMPVAVFCSITSMMLTMGMESILSVLSMLGTFLVGLVGMMAVYCLLMLVLARLNPLPFLRKYAPVMVQVFSMASSNASIPVNMSACEEKLGISRRVFSLSIPLGATLNMDGTCIHLAVFALALAKVYGVTVTGGMLLSMVLSIVVLSMGAPGIPGAGLICLSVLLTQMNVPAEAIGLVMGIDSLVGMFRCMSNCLGDVAVTAIVARGEGEMDMEAYAR